jgi:hypothetical protein
VVAVAGGAPAALSAWEIPGPELPFREREIVLVEHPAMSRV